MRRGCPKFFFKMAHSGCILTRFVSFVSAAESLKKSDWPMGDF